MHPEQYIDQFAAKDIAVEAGTATEEIAGEIERARMIAKELEQRLVNALRSPHPVESQSTMPPPEPSSPLRSMANDLRDHNNHMAYILDRIDL